MYINSIEIDNIKSLVKNNIQFVHPECDYKELGIPKPKLPNVNLL